MTAQDLYCRDFSNSDVTLYINECIKYQKSIIFNDLLTKPGTNSVFKDTVMKGLDVGLENYPKDISSYPKGGEETYPTNQSIQE